MNRLRSLDPPHKGLRNALGRLALAAGKADYTSSDSIGALKNLATEVFHLLKEHTLTENKFILAPLEERKPGFTTSYFSDHDKIEKMELDLFNRFMTLNGEQTNDHGHVLYLDFCQFQSEYLSHINEEDYRLEEELQKHFTDDELMKHQLQIMNEMSFESLLLWFKYIVPARRPEENAQVLTGFKAAAPAAAFSAVINAIRQELSEKELEQLMSLVS